VTTASPAFSALELPWELEPTAKHVFEVMGTARAVRYFNGEPVSSDRLDALVWAATRASSPDNSQLWDFVVVTDAGVKSEISSVIRSFLDTVSEMDPTTDDVRSRTRTGAVHLIRHLADVPALIFVCGQNSYPVDAPEEKYLWGALHAASQNMVVAGRSMGLSVVLTMLHIAAPGKLRSLLNLPSDVRIGSMMAVGWPAKIFGPVTRRPIEEVIHRDRW
jgi:nitroreductase